MKCEADDLSTQRPHVRIRNSASAVEAVINAEQIEPRALKDGKFTCLTLDTMS